MLLVPHRRVDVHRCVVFCLLHGHIRRVRRQCVSLSPFLLLASLSHQVQSCAVVPLTAGARVFCMLYASIGLVLLALTIAVARETIIETFEANYRSRRDKLAERARVRKEEARRRAVEGRERRRRVLEEAAARQGWAAGEGEAQEGGCGAAGGGRGGRAAVMGRINGSKEERVALDMPTRTLTFSAPTLPEDDHLPADSLLHRLRRTVSRPFHHAAKEVDFRRSLKDFRSGGSLARRSSISSLSSSLTTSSLDESFRSLKDQLVREQREEFRIKLGISFGLFLIFWLGGSAIFMVTERWTYGVALYFSCTYFLTIGCVRFRSAGPSLPKLTSPPWQVRRVRCASSPRRPALADVVLLHRSYSPKSA